MEYNKRVIEAEEFVLKGADGETRATLAEEEGSVMLRLFDTDGINRCMVGVQPSGAPVVALKDDNGMPRLILSQSEETTGIEVLDDWKQTQIQIGVKRSGTDSIIQLRRPGTLGAIALVMREDGSNSVVLTNAQGEPMVGLRIETDGEPIIMAEPFGNILRAFSTDQPEAPTDEPK